ncbi:MAG TPA: glycine--tRNA ligase subunit beta [Nitrospirales bacterium]|nr:glycine--tRNA ligase subunit beta [Nitrospirales bacterium]
MAPSRTTRKNVKAKPVQKTPPKKLPFLLEIGTEELPSAVIPQALEDLANLGQRLFADGRLEYESLRTVGTPRRLALLVKGVQPQQASLTQEIFGPPASAAFDASGQPTKAAMGFAKSQGVPVDQLRIKETPKGAYMAVEMHQRGQSAKRVITEVLPQSLSKLAFPKAMRWNASRAKFGRPIRWVVALLGDQPLTIEFAGIRSSPLTRGHRFYRTKGKKPGQRVPLTTANNYIETMKRVGVLVDPEERRSLITQQVSALAKTAKGEVDPLFRDELIETAVFGVEYPHTILGTFQKEFLAIPKPVLISSMKEHQGFFSLMTKDGALLPKFIAVTNMPWGNTRLMTKGNERVLAARLSDAQYFFTEDSKRPLPERVPGLEGVLFHHKLGTVRQKVDRVGHLVGWMAEQIGRKDLQDVCRRSALLAKADLTTGMVGEFPTLQGVMGEEYARHDGESAEVCRAIGEQYFPRFPDDQLPTGLPGVLLALADRCDSIVAFFAAGMSPSGSEDPLGLRRAAYGLVRIITETPLRLNVVSVVEQALQILDGQGGPVRSTAQTGLEVVAFILDRLRFYGRQHLGLREDVMEAVIRVPHSMVCDVADLVARMQALQVMVYQPDFEPLMIGFKRAHRIVEKEHWTDSQAVTERFVHESEHRLFQALGAMQQRISDSVNDRNYGKALHSLLELKCPIDEFFGAVMVNDPDPQTRANRLSLLKATDDLFLTIADLSCLQSANG